jgi:lysophospholipase L1-like esterase
LPRPATFDLKIDGSLVASRSTDSGNKLVIDFRDRNSMTFEPGEPTTIRFEGLGTGRKRVEMWLPHNATVEMRAVRIDDDATVSEAPPTNRPVWVHYGSSISHCMEASRPTGTWPAVAATLAGVDLRSLGLAGACHLDQFVARTIRDMPADVISLKVGINVFNADSFKERTFAPALHGFLDTVREGKPTTPILVVSPIICPPGENHPGPSIPTAGGKYPVDTRPESKWYGSLTLSAIRTTIEQVVNVRRHLGDANLHYLNGLELFGAADAGGLPDDLHPSGAGYQLMGERFARLAFGAGRALDRSQ